MKKLITGLIMATALASPEAYSQGHISSSDVLASSKFQDANNLEFTVIGESHQALQKANDASPLPEANHPSDWSSQAANVAWGTAK